MADDVESEPEDRFYDYVQNVLKEEEENEDNEDFDEKEDELYLKAYTGQLQFDPKTTQIQVATPDAKGKLISDDNQSTPGSRYFFSEDANSSSDSDDDGSLILPSIHTDLNDEDDKKAGPQRRYYEPENENIKCFNCNGFGHMASQCLEEKRDRPCILCGELGHDKFSCPRDICWNCNEPGHVRMHCKSPRNTLVFMSCNRCGRVGHKSNTCNVDLRNKAIYREPRDVFCYNCGDIGHTGPECDAIRIDQESRGETRSSIGSSRGSSSKRKQTGSYKRFKDASSSDDEILEYYDPDSPTTSSDDEREIKGSRKKKSAKKDW